MLASSPFYLSLVPRSCGSKTDYLRPRLQTGMGLSHAGVYGVVKAAEIDNTCSNGKLRVAQHLTIYKYSLAHELADEYHELSESTDSAD